MQKNTINRFVLSLIPLLSFFYTSIYYFILDESFQIFWLCNILNFVLFLAIITHNLTQIWSVTILLIIGTPLWLYEDIIVHQVFRWNAFFIHVIASIIGLIVMKQNEPPKFVALTSICWLIVGFLLARLCTDDSHNVNLAFFVYPTLTKVFPHFWLYSIFNFVSFSIGILLLNKILKKIIPVQKLSH